MSEARLTLALTSERAEISRLVHAVEEFGRAHDLLEDDIHSLELILDEVIINVIKHGHKGRPGHRIDVELTLENEVATVRVADSAPAFDPTTAPPPNLDLPIEERPYGGLGIHITKSIATSMTYERIGDRNVLTMTKALTK